MHLKNPEEDLLFLNETKIGEFLEFYKRACFRLKATNYFYENSLYNSYK